MVKQKSTIQLCLKILAECREYWPSLIIVFLLSLAIVPFAVIIPYPLKFVVDNIILAKPLPPFIIDHFPQAIAGSISLLWLACIMEFSILVVKSFFTYGSWAYQVYVSERILISARVKLFEHVQQLSIQFIDRKGMSEIFYHLQNDVTNMHSIAINGMIPFISTVLTFLSMFFVAFQLDSTLALLALIVLPATWFLSAVHIPRSRKRWTEVKNKDQGALAIIQEVLGSMRIVRAFSQEKREANRLEKKAKEKLRVLIRTTLIEAVYGILVSATVAAASAATLYFGIKHVQSGQISLGSFLVITAYLVQLFRPLDGLSKQTSTMQAALASAERVFRLYSETPDVRDIENAKTIGLAKGKIELQDVSFQYSDGRTVLEHVSFRVEPGGRVGIVGPTGGGKTTLTGLLLRFFDPKSGKILLDDQDIRSIRIADVRKQFSLVLQEPVLFTGTIAENIAYGRPNATLEEIRQAAISAEADDFVSRLTNGYSTQVGDRGMSLSGGERQRISIARAFLVNAPILIMDEPTSNLDEERESALAISLKRLQQGKTIFTVSHRMALLDEYDYILRVENGTVTHLK